MSREELENERKMLDFCIAQPKKKKDGRIKRTINCLFSRGSLRALKCMAMLRDRALCDWGGRDARGPRKIGLLPEEEPEMAPA